MDRRELSALEINSKIEILPICTDSLLSSTPCSELVRYMQANVHAPGILIYESMTAASQGKPMAVFSRDRFFAQLTSLALQNDWQTAPISSLVDQWVQVRQFVVLDANHSIQAATLVALSQPRDSLLNPPVVQSASRTGLLDIRDLLQAHAAICQYFPPADRKQVELSLSQEINVDERPRDADLLMRSEALQSEWKRLSHFKDDLLDAFARELRSPISNMRLSIELLKQQQTLTKRTSYLQMLESECSRELDLLADLLEMHRPTQDIEPTIHGAVQLEEWLLQVFEPVFGRTQQRQQKLTLDISPDMPTHVGEQRTLERILVELLGHACKHTPSGGEIRIGLRNRVPSGLELSVAHTTATQTTPPESASMATGRSNLSLALVLRLVERLKGTMSIDRSGAGVTFVVMLP